MKRTIKTLTLASLAAAAIGAGVIYAGLINVGADDPHLAGVHALLTTARERSIAVRARDIEVPDLNDAELIRAGAGNYHSMCIGCHLAPGVAPTELSQNLYPAPPNLAQIGANGNPSVAFWIIKHGIKATGMPAWGKSMGDEHIWGMVAFLQQLPSLDATQYRALVAASDGHSHGGGETQMHDHSRQHGHPGAAPSPQPPAASHHGDGQAHGHDQAVATAPAAPEKQVHVHADGKEHVHH
ncbi:c-type cytochrome [Geopseudomonas aromaticivorans]